MRRFSHPLIGILALVALGGAILYFTRLAPASTFGEAAPQASVGVLAVSLDTPAPIPDGYVEYKNAKYGFSYYHSPKAVIREYDEGGGATTIVQENVAKVRGLQIFIVPYAGTTITEERFKKDAPSGIRTDVESATIDGVPAVTFHGYAAPLGETREVWFIHNGYLFEVTTFKGFADWFVPIMQTWRFL